MAGNCLASKVTGAFSRQIGQDYLNQCVGDVVTDIVLSDKVSFELDPTYCSSPSGCQYRINLPFLSFGSPSIVR